MAIFASFRAQAQSAPLHVAWRIVVGSCAASPEVNSACLRAQVRPAHRTRRTKKYSIWTRQTWGPIIKSSGVRGQRSDWRSEQRGPHCSPCKLTDISTVSCWGSRKLYFLPSYCSRTTPLPSKHDLRSPTKANLLLPFIWSQHPTWISRLCGHL